MTQGKAPATRLLTKQAIEQQRKRLGMKFDTCGSQRGPNQVAHWDNISVFVENIGDPNPLWRDEERARKSPYGTVVAPPAFILSVWPGAPVQGLPGVQAMLGGASYEFHKPVLDGTKVLAESVFSALEEKTSKFSPLWAIETYDNTYTNDRGELLATVRSQVLRWDRSDIAGGLKRTDRSDITFPHKWTDAEIKAVEDEVMTEFEHIRGATPRYWEDVQVGEALPVLVRGPRRLLDAIAESIAMTVWRYGAVDLAEMKKHPELAIWNDESLAHENIAVLTFDWKTAKALGFPHSPDVGAVRQYHGMEAILDWAGDDAWLKSYSSQLRRVVYISDVTRTASRVVKKYVDKDGEPCVDIEQSMVNQRGDNVMPGKATVVLPLKAGNTSPVTRRVAR